MIYTHVLNRPDIRVTSPLDRLEIPIPQSVTSLAVVSPRADTPKPVSQELVAPLRTIRSVSLQDRPIEGGVVTPLFGDSNQVDFGHRIQRMLSSLVSNASRILGWRNKSGHEREGIDHHLFKQERF